MVACGTVTASARVQLPLFTHLERRKKMSLELISFQNIVSTVPAPMGLLLFNKNMDVVCVNEGMAGMFRYTADQMIDKNWYDLLPPMVSRKAKYDLVLLGGKEIHEEGVAMDIPAPFHESPGKRYYDVSYKPIKDGTNIVGMMSVAMDVTDRRRKGLELEEANRKLVEAQLFLDTVFENMASHIGTYRAMKDFFSK